MMRPGSVGPCASSARAERFLGFLNRSAMARQVSPETLIDEMIQTNQHFTLRHDQ